MPNQVGLLQMFVQYQTEQTTLAAVAQALGEIFEKALEPTDELADCGDVAVHELRAAAAFDIHVLVHPRSVLAMPPWVDHFTSDRMIDSSRVMRYCVAEYGLDPECDRILLPRADVIDIDLDKWEAEHPEEVGEGKDG